MRKLFALAFVGFVAQLIDGSLGMAYGATSTTFLIAVGTTPAIASAAVHLGELGTTAVSGTAHWKFGNVDWRTVRLMAFPGAVAAFLGAVVLSSINGRAAVPWVSGLLLLLGAVILYRFLSNKTATQNKSPLPAFFLRGLGVVAGFLDAVGGAGWGPVGTPALLSSGRLEPRKVVGSVDTSEFLVALGASLGFLISMSWKDIPLLIVVILLGSGILAAPLAAYLVRRLSARKLGVLVGGGILLTNARTLSLAIGLDARPRAWLYTSLAFLVGLIALLRMLQIRRARTEATV